MQMGKKFWTIAGVHVVLCAISGSVVAWVGWQLISAIIDYLHRH